MVSEGVCRAFAEAIKLYPEIINQALLCDNQFIDSKLGYLLEGLCSLENLKMLIIRNNEIQDSSTKWLKDILSKDYPNHVEEFRMI